MSDRVTPAMLEFYERAKSYAMNAIDLGVDFEDFREAITIAVVDAALEKAQGNKGYAAQLLNVHRNTIGEYAPKKIAHKWVRTIQGERKI